MANFQAWRRWRRRSGDELANEKTRRPNLGNPGGPIMISPHQQRRNRSYELHCRGIPDSLRGSCRKPILAEPIAAVTALRQGAPSQPLLPRPPIRHPGEGRDPPCNLSYADEWIPAFAGMTNGLGT